MTINYYSVFDTLAIILIVLMVYNLIKKTEAFEIIVGFLIIFIMSMLAFVAQFENTYLLLKTVTQWLFLGVVIIFQNEIRISLRGLGRFLHKNKKAKSEVIDNIEEAAFEMSSKGIGALILIDHKHLVPSIAENRVRVDAKCTKELLETIFYPHTSLHDGAVVVVEDRIVYARCKLPLSGKERKDLGDLGTRHLAAIEIAEKFDIIAIVVSEESGNVSVINKKGRHVIEKREEFRKYFDIEGVKKKWF